MEATFEKSRENWAGVIAALASGDSAAACKITSVVSGLLARQRCSGVADARDDIHQETLLRFLRSVRRRRMHSPDACVSYLSTIARRALLDCIAERRRNAPHLEDWARSPAEREVARSDDPAVLLDLARCLRALSERERRVIELIYLEGRSYEESGALLNMPQGTLRAIRTRALKKLREAMLDRRLERDQTDRGLTSGEA